MGLYDDLIPDEKKKKQQQTQITSSNPYADLIPKKTPSQQAAQQNKQPTFWESLTTGAKRLKDEFVTGVKEASASVKGGLGVALQGLADKRTENISAYGTHLGSSKYFEEKAKELRAKGNIKLAEQYETMVKDSLAKEAQTTKFFSDTANKLKRDAIKTFADAKAYEQANLPIEDPKTFLEGVKDPGWIARNVVRSTPNLLASLGISGVTLYATKNPAAAVYTGFGTSFALESGSAYQDAKDFGVDEKLAQNVAVTVGSVNGLLDFIPIKKFLDRTPQGQLIKKQMMKEITKGVIKQAALESSTESLQQIVSNAVAKTYDDNRDFFAGVPESALIGGILGGGLSVGGDVSATLTQKSSKDIVKEINQKVEDARKTPEEERTEEQKQLLVAADDKSEFAIPKIELVSEEGTPQQVTQEPVVPVEPVKAVASIIPSVKDAANYTSAADFASEVYSAKPSNQIGLVDSSLVTPRDPVDKNSQQYKDLLADIQANGIKEPIRVTVEGKTILTTDGSQRTSVAQDLGIELPVIVNEGKIEGLQTIQDIYKENSGSKAPEKVSFTSKQAKETQAIFVKTLDDIRVNATSQEDIIQKVSIAASEAIESAGDDKTKLAGLRTAINKELFGQVGKSGNYKADFAMLQTLKEDPEIGEYLNFLEDQVIQLDKKLGRSQSGAVFADKDPFTETLENVTKEVEKSQFKVVEFPEMLRLAEELMGKRPVATASKRGKYRGAFIAKEDGTIILKADIFKSPEQAAKTLAHEIGHLMDYLPDKTMARGNLIGRLTSLREFMRNTFSSIESEKKIDALFKRVQALQKQRQEIKSKYKTDTKEFKPFSAEDKQKDLALLRQMRPLNKEIRMLQTKSIKNPVIKEELLNLSAKWRPIPDGTGTADDIRNDDYRASSPELYADAISVLFNDPVRLEQEAPEFWKNFFKFLDQKPEVKENFFEIQKLLNSDPEKIFRQRDEDMNKAYDDAEKIFAAKELEKRKRKSSFLYQIQVLFNDKNQPVINKVKEAQKAGVSIEDSVNPMYELAGLNYMDAKLKNFIEDSFEPVFAKAQSVTNGWVTLGKVLQLERTIFERGEMANPGGYDPKTAKDQLEALEKYTDPADWKTIQEAKEAFRSGVQKSITMAEEAGYYTPELLKQMKANPAYASYQVIDYLDTYVSAKVYKSVGTLKDIANPATSTVMKMISMMKAIERNKVKVDTVDLLLEAFPKEIESAKTAFNGKAQEILDPKDPDQGLVITIRDGKAVGHYVNKEIASTLTYLSNDTVNMAAKVTRWLALSPFYRPLFTSLNLGFQTFNFVRDFERYWKNVPDFTLRDAVLSLPRAAYRYSQAVPIAARRVRGKEDAVIREMENSQMLGLKYNDIFKDPVDPDEKQIERVLQRIGILEKEKKRKLLTPIYKVLDAIELTGNFIETLPKVAGYIELKGKMPEKELAHFIRTKVGSPDFRTAGTLTPISNNIFMFSNAIKEGIKSDISVARGTSEGGKYSQSGFWWKTVVGTLLPKVIMAGMAAGLMGEWLKDRLEDVSEYDKTSYTIIPLGVDENKKTVYLRIPQDETSRFIGSIFWKSLNFATKKDLESISDIFAVGSGQFPTVSPSFTGIGATLEYLSGRNPYDSFRGRNVIPDTEFKAGYAKSFPIFAEWLMKQQGAGILVPSFTPQGESTLLEKVINAPVISNIAGRWIKVSDYGQTEINKEIQQDTEAEAARKTLERRELVDKYVKEWQKSDKSEATKRDLIVKFTRESTAGVTENKQRTATEARQKIRMALNYGEHGANTDSLIRASTNQAKAMILKRVEQSMGRDEFIKYKRLLRSEGIISDDVLEKLGKMK